MWDLTTALELKPSEQTSLGGPSASEFVRLLDQCDLSSVNSGYSTPTTNCLSPCPSLHSFNPQNSSKYFNSKNLLVSSNMNNRYQLLVSYLEIRLCFDKRNTSSHYRIRSGKQGLAFIFYSRLTYRHNLC